MHLWGNWCTRPLNWSYYLVAYFALEVWDLVPNHWWFLWKQELLMPRRNQTSWRRLRWWRKSLKRTMSWVCLLWTCLAAAQRKSRYYLYWSLSSTETFLTTCVRPRKHWRQEMISIYEINKHFLTLRCALLFFTTGLYRWTSTVSCECASNV